MDNVNLFRLLSNHLGAVDAQIKTVMDDAFEKGCSEWALQYSDGKYVLPDLLLAKAQILNGMAIILATDPNTGFNL